MANSVSKRAGLEGCFYATHCSADNPGVSLPAPTLTQFPRLKPKGVIVATDPTSQSGQKEYLCDSLWWAPTERFAQPPASAYSRLNSFLQPCQFVPPKYAPAPRILRSSSSPAEYLPTGLHIEPTRIHGRARALQHSS